MRHATHSSIAWALRALLAAATCIVFLGGCAYKYEFVVPDAEPSEQRVEEWRHIGIWGWVPAEPFDLLAACPGGVAEFGSHVSFLNWLPALVTAGLYAPRTVYAVCDESDGPGAA